MTEKNLVDDDDEWQSDSAPQALYPTKHLHLMPGRVAVYNHGNSESREHGLFGLVWCHYDGGANWFWCEIDDSGNAIPLVSQEGFVRVEQAK